MPATPNNPCPNAAQTHALAHDRLSHAVVPDAYRHLERCAGCRGAFRGETAAWLPQVANYTIIRQVGRGGCGAVYRAVHHEKERTEAIKLHFGASPVRMAYFENEVHLVARLRHTNIAMLYEANLHAAPPYFAMEFVEGEQLDDYFRSHATPIAQRIRVLSKIARAVGYAHTQGVVHRDLKPQNVLIDAQGEPRIVDFGIGKRLQEALQGSSATQPEGVIGTVGYIAPEQLAGRSVDGRGDVYSLGVLLYHVCTGAPGRSADRSRLLRELRARGLARPEDLAAVIARCLAPEPEERYETCEALVADLDNYLESRPIAARRDRPLGYRAARLASFLLTHHPGAVYASATALIALALCGWLVLTKASMATAARPMDQAVLIAFTPDTVAAIRDGRIGAGLVGLSPSNRKSWRMLHGELLARLAAARPRAVAMDYFFPTCQPEFDDAFVAGARALPCPLIVGAAQFDVNGEPQICETLRPHVRRVATLAAPKLDSLSGQYLVSWALLRGFEEPIPSLPLAAFAAWRFPDADAELEIDAERAQIELRYQRRTHAAHERRFLTITDRVALREVVPVRTLPVLSSGDRVAHGAIVPAPDDLTAQRTIPYEDVLTADPAQMHDWFAGKVVLVGQMIGPEDRYRDRTGRTIYGCQVQFQSLRALLGDVPMALPLDRLAIALRVVGWCALGGLLGALAAPLLRRAPLRLVVGIGAAAALAGFAVALLTAGRVPMPLRVESGLAIAALLAAGGVALALSALRRSQLDLAPDEGLSPETTSLSTTLRAGTA